MRAFLDYVLDAYEKHGVDELASRKIADFLLRIRYSGTNDAERLLGPVPAIREAFIAIQAHLYQGASLRALGQDDLPHQAMRRPSR